MSRYIPGIAKAIQPAFFVFEGNYNQLMELLKFVEESPERFWLRSGYKTGLLYANIEITRLFHNYAASAMTLVDHYRAHIEVLDNIKELSSFMKEYKKEKKKRFEQNENHQLIQGFRNYMLHWNIRETRGTDFWHVGKAPKYIIKIPTELLLEWDGWKPLARKRLMQDINGIPLRVFIEEYYNDVKAFYSWIWDNQRELIQNHVLPLERELTDEELNSGYRL